MANKIFKFGGALLNSINGFLQLKKIIAKELDTSTMSAANKTNENNDCVIVVISALEKTTSKLLNAAKTAEQQGYVQSKEMIDNIFLYHIELIDQLITTEKNNKLIKNFLNVKRESLLNIIKGISITKELSPRTKDLVLSYGEIIASNIISFFLSESFSGVILFDISDVLVTDNNFGAAKPLIEETKTNINNRLLPLTNYYNIIVTQGFIATSNTKEITTMGYESSNLTATIIAGITNADEFVIWTNTEGIRECDPFLAGVHKTKLVQNISYDFAEYLAYSGLKLIHPPMIHYLKMFNLSVKYKSGFYPDGEFSTIGINGNDENYKFILYNDNFSAYNKSNRSNRLDSDCFPQLAFLLHNHNNTIHISPDGHLYIATDVPSYVEDDLLSVGLEKTEGISSLTFINFEQTDCLHFLDDLCSGQNANNILEMYLNKQRNTMRIYYLTKDDAITKNVINLYFRK